LSSNQPNSTVSYAYDVEIDNILHSNEYREVLARQQTWALLLPYFSFLGTIIFVYYIKKVFLETETSNKRISVSADQKKNRQTLDIDISLQDK